MPNNTGKKNKTARPRVAVSVKRHPGKVERVYLAVVDLGNGEGIYSVGVDGQTLPVVAVGSKGLGTLIEYAREQVNRTGRTVSIIGFSKRTQQKVFRPSTNGDKK